MRSGLNLYKRREKRYSLDKIYKSIADLPQWNWIKFHETGNPAYIKVLDNYFGLKLEKSDRLNAAWNNVISQYIDEFGFSEDFNMILEHKKEIARLQIEYIETRDKYLFNLIEMERLELEDLLVDNSGVTYEETVMMIEKRVGIPIDPLTISVYKYNMYLKNLKSR